jgi:hypothetical protein
MKRYRLYKFTVLLFIIISCNPYGIYENAKEVKRIQTKKYVKDIKNQNEKQKLFIDYLYTVFFNIRTEQVNKIIEIKKMKNFIINESFYFDDTAGSRTYGAHILIDDSIYIFNYLYDKMYVRKMRENGSCLYYTFRNDSVIINSGLVVNYEAGKGEPCKGNIEDFLSQYFSYYEDGKLNYFVANKKIKYQKKKSRLSIDLNTIKWTGKDGECTKKNGIIQCHGDLTLRCIEGDGFIPPHCDTLK